MISAPVRPPAGIALHILALAAKPGNVALGHGRAARGPRLGDSYLLIWNVVQMGSWRGSFPSTASLDLSYAVLSTVVAFYHIILGDYSVVPITVWMPLFLIAIVGALAGAVLAWRRVAGPAPGSLLHRALSWIGLFALCYVAGVIAASMSTLAKDMVRYDLPVYPLLLAGLAGASSLLPYDGARLALAVTVSMVLVLHSLTFAFRPARPLHAVVAANLQEEVYGGESLQRWLHDHVPPGAVLAAEEGQALHYVLGRPVVSIMEPPDISNRPVDSAAFRTLMSGYHSEYLVLFPTMRPAPVSLPFLQDLLSGRSPDWLTLRARTPDVAVFECEVCAK